MRKTSWRTTPSARADIEYLFPMGWSELEGIANRTDFDLKQHAQFSGKTLEYFDEESKQKVVPFVIEPSAGADRGTLAFLVDAYREEEVKGEKRVVLNFHPELAPIKIAVLPLLEEEPTDRRDRAEAVRRSAQALALGLRRHRVDRPTLPPPGRSRHAVLRHRRRANRRR